MTNAQLRFHVGMPGLRRECGNVTPNSAKVRELLQALGARGVRD